MWVSVNHVFYVNRIRQLKRINTVDLHCNDCCAAFGTEEERERYDKERVFIVERESWVSSKANGRSLSWGKRRRRRGCTCQLVLLLRKYSSNPLKNATVQSIVSYFFPFYFTEKFFWRLDAYTEKNSLYYPFIRKFYISCVCDVIRPRREFFLVIFFFNDRSTFYIWH